MNKKIPCSISISITLLLLNTAMFGKNPENNAALKARAEQWVQNQRVAFLENKGQMADMKGNPIPSVLFKVEASGMNFFITEKGLTYMFIKAEEEHEKENERITGDGDERGETDENITTEYARIDMALQGASIKKENIIITKPSETDFNFFYPHCKDGIYGVKEYEEITIKEVYPGIDWVFHNSNSKGLEHDFIVHPGADPKQIEMIYSSLNPLNLNKDGQIEIATKLGTLTEHAPISYQNNDASADGMREIKSAFTKNSSVKNNQGGYDTHIRFEVDRYDAANTLIIDPTLNWATFYGGSNIDGPMSITTDGSGNIFVAGYTQSTNFPVNDTGTFFQGALGGSFNQVDVFIVKFDNAGKRIWATYYGGSAKDGMNTNGGNVSVAVDKNGNVFVTGKTASSDFPVQDIGTFFQGTIAGSMDAFILKFDNAGNRLWATYYGGGAYAFGCCGAINEGSSIVVDSTGNVFITGYTNSTNFPVQNSGTFFQDTCAGCLAGSVYYDIFILKFDNAGNRLWATYYGGSDDERGNSMALDANGNVFITGFTWSSDFPVQDAGTFFQGTRAGSQKDVFILKFDNAGNRLWATYYGGSGWINAGNAIALDGNGNVFVTGVTNSTDFPLQDAGTFFQNTLSVTAGFILKFNNAGNRLWATFYANSGNYIVVDKCGTVYQGASSPNTTTKASCDSGYYSNDSHGGGDILISQFSNAGALLWATYFGGDGVDFLQVRKSLAVDNAGSLFVSGEWTGVTSPATYPLKDPGSGAYYQPAFGGSHDGFIAKFINTPLNLNTSVVNSCTCLGSASVTPNGGCPYLYLWSNGQTTQTATGLCPGNYTVTVTDTMLCPVTSTASVTITAPAALTSTTAVVPCANGLPNGSATVTLTAGTAPYTYAWATTPVQITATATGLATGTYMVTVTDVNNCTGSAQVVIDPCVTDSILIPNVFTPNGDGVNDVFHFPNIGYKTLHCEIYNRWGTKIYEWEEPKGGWDGRTSTGKMAVDGVYYYIMKAEKLSGEEVKNNGFLQLLSNK